MKESILKDIKERIKTDKKLLIIIILAFLAIAFLLISELDLSDKETDEVSKTSKNESSYSENIETQLKDIISSIEGAGSTKVMVTLENSAEQVYAQNEKNKSDSDSNLDKSNSSNLNEHEYVLIKSSSRGEEGLVIKLVEPKIRGVAIVCEGGDSEKIKAEIIETVTAVLDISASRVYVAKMG